MENMNEEKTTCGSCGKDAAGYKCGVCGAESAEAGKECCGEECRAKCAGCNEAESACGCEKTA